MIIQINRYRYKADSIDGHLFIDGSKICDTAERFSYHIPSGTYSISIVDCPIGARKMPVINLNEGVGCRVQGVGSSLVPPSQPSPCELCQKVNSENINIRLKPWKAIDRIIQMGIDNGELEDEYMAKARAKESDIEAKKLSGDKRFCQKPMPKCPRITTGNGVFNLTDHSIIVGKYLQPGCVIHSKPAFDTLYERIRKNIERGQKVLLIIND